MGDTQPGAASETIVEGSVSFGRFLGDSLSWDKWSSFSQNKYLEEVEKCSTPGSVAEKKAYFEAHYRRIAATQKDNEPAELKMVSDSLRSQYPNCELLKESIDAERDYNSIEGSVNKMGERAPRQLVSITRQVDEQTVKSEPDIRTRDDPDLINNVEETGALVEKEKQQVTEPKKSQTEPCKNSSVRSQVTKPSLKVGDEHETRAPKDEILGGRMKKKKKKEADIVKKSSKIALATPKATTSRIIRSAKMGNSSVPTSKKAPAADSKKSTSGWTSLYKSSSTRSGYEEMASSVTTNSTNTWRGSIVEEMGDKEIVKRAFKAYLSKPSIVDANSSEPKQVGSLLISNLERTAKMKPVALKFEMAGLCKGTLPNV